MSKVFKKMISMVLSAALLISIFPVSGNAAYSEQVASEQRINNILDEFYTKTQLSQKSDKDTARLTTDYNNEIRKNTVKALQAAGYEAYDVTGDTFEQIEQTLGTDLDTIGLSKDYSYIIILSGEAAPSKSTRDAYDGTAGSEFQYTYGGQSYTLRYMTVTAANVPAYGMASTVNLLESKSQTAIKNCLNTAISMYLGAVWQPLGTVTSLIGLDVSDFALERQATLNLNAASNWTRVFTQVKDYDGSWVYGSSVEYVRTTSYLSGHYYDASTNMYKSVDAEEKSGISRSAHYYDYTWRKNKAIDSLFGAATYDLVDPIKYKYGNVVKITHDLYYY